MATLSVLNFCTLSHVHSAPKGILEKTHISSSLVRVGGKKPSQVNFCKFFMKYCDIFMNVCDLFIKFYRSFANFISIRKEKNWKSTGFPPLLIKEEEIWVFSRIQFRVLWAWLGVRKSKTDNVAINFPSLGSQRKRIYSFWPMELWAVQLSKKPLDI